MTDSSATDGTTTGRVINDRSNANKAAKRATAKDGIERVVLPAPNGGKGFVIEYKANAPQDDGATATAPQDHAAPATAPQDDGATATAPQDDTAPATPPQDDTAPATAPQDDGATATAPQDDGATATAPQDDAAPATPPQDDAAPATPPQDDTFVSPVTNDALAEAARDQAVIFEKAKEPKLAWLLRELADRLPTAPAPKPARAKAASTPRPRAAKDTDPTIKPIIASATNQSVQRLIDRIDAARGDLPALLAFKFARSSTYYAKAGVFLDALIEQAKAAPQPAAAPADQTG